MKKHIPTVLALYIAFVFIQSLFFKSKVPGSPYAAVLPFPVPDRDVLARVTWQQDTDTLAVTMQSKATQGLMP